MLLLRGAVLSALLAGSAHADARCSAHRGDNAAAPENTIPAIAAAVRMGAKQIEFDVRLSRDGRLVIMHDATVDRTTNGTGKVAELTFSGLRALDAGSWFGEAFAGTKVPTLEEVLAAIPKGVRMNVHLADVAGVAMQAASLLARMGRLDDAFLACTLEQAAEVRGAFPQLRICNMSRQGGDLWKYVDLTIAAKAGFIQLRDGAGGAIPQDLAKAVEKLHRHGITVNYFGANDAVKIRALAAAGVDYILTDRLALCRQELGEAGSKE